MIRCSIQKRGVLLSIGSLIDAVDLLLPYAKNNAVATIQANFSPLCSLEELEKIHIENALKQMNWNKTKAADRLGISVGKWYRKLISMG
jgi:two-component system, NtrC family, response regulator AtoC